jgi:hypothetical protein
MNNLSRELMFKKDWIFDPPSDLFRQVEFGDLAKLAVIQLRAEHAMTKVYEEALEEAIEVYTGFAGK